jgi:pre-rRNA-processing protein TSR4
VSHVIFKKNHNVHVCIIFRYGGDPLLLYPLQEKASLCAQCRGELKFELQILPTLIPKLRLSGNPDDATHLEFGSVFLYACRNSCWLPNDKVKEELLIVQMEKM